MMSKPSKIKVSKKGYSQPRLERGDWDRLQADLKKESAWETILRGERKLLSVEVN